MSVIPEVEGTISIASSSDRFFHACRQRVAAGLLTGQPDPRSNYVVSDARHDHVEISMHKRPLRELIGRLIADMDAAGVSAP